MGIDVLGWAKLSGAARRGLRLLVVSAASTLALAACAGGGQQLGSVALMGGPFGAFLAESTDLGPARDHQVKLTVGLYNSGRPQALISWAQGHRLSVQWHAGDSWAYLAGPAQAVAGAFAVPVHDYRSPEGTVFYAAQQDPPVPAAVAGEVSGLGRILSYRPVHVLRPPMIPRDVPNNELSPDELRMAYGANTLGQGAKQTIVFFEIDAFNQKDLDRFHTKFGVPSWQPQVVGVPPPGPGDETPMDLQVAYGIAPGAAQVVYYLPDDGYPGVAKSMADADQRWPGAIWSLSLGFGCDGFDKPDDIKDVRTAIENAEKRGTSVFVSSGDTGGYECKGQIPNQPDFYGPPVADDIGVSTLAALPPVTDVGGTTLSTDANGAWADEMGWSEYTVTNGTGGGVSRLFERPDWQRGVSVPPGSAATIASLPDPPDPATRRLTPDVAADADPATGVAIYECGDDDTDCQAQPGGGTSQAAPIWAALTALMNEYLTSHGGQPVSNVNPLLYKAAASGARPGFRDVTAGGNCVYNSAPGFNLATGLGTPNTINLVQDILDIQKTGPVR